MSEGKGKGEAWGVMNCSSLTVPSANATNYMQDMHRMKHGSFSPSMCPPLWWPGSLSRCIRELTAGPCTPRSHEMNDLPQALLSKWHFINHPILSSQYLIGERPSKLVTEVQTTFLSRDVPHHFLILISGL